MLKLAQEKMTGTKLYQGNLQDGLVGELKREKYDAIIAYAPDRLSRKC